MNKKEKIYFFAFEGKWKLSDGSFYFSEGDLIFSDKGWNYYRYVSDGYVTYLKKQIN